MIELLGNIVGFVMDMVGMAIDIAFGAVEFVFGLLGGLLSLVFSLAWVGALIAVVVFIVRRRRGGRQHHARKGHIYDLDEEEFVSFYDQEESAQFTRE